MAMDFSYDPPLTPEGHSQVRTPDQTMRKEYSHTHTHTHDMHTQKHTHTHTHTQVATQRALSSELDVEVVLVSPMRRTLQTAVGRE